jgi:hypothetical protein
VSGRSPWKALGIAPTSDLRAIRSAYAAKLKAIDVDNDPAAFQALRALYDQVRHLAYRRQAQQADVAALDAVEDEESISGDADAELIEASPSAEADSDPVHDLNTLRQQIWEILADRRAQPWAANNLVSATQRLLQLPLLDRIDVADDTERWLAAIAAQHIPKSDPIIDLLVRHFGWDKHADSISTFYGLNRVLERQKDMECSVRLHNPSHDWHQAFTYLQQPPGDDYDADEKRRIGNHIRRLLESIRYHHPTVEEELDARHVALWAKAQKRFAPSLRDRLPDFTAAQWIGFAVFMLALINLAVSKLAPLL